VIVKMEQKILHFFGPYSFMKSSKSLFHSQYAKSEGIYLWVIKDKNKNLNYIEYVGETTNFAKRHREHITNFLGLNYRILDAQSALQGIPKIIWNGMWRDKSENAVGDTLENYDLISNQVTQYIKLIDVYFATTKFSSDIRKHIEGCIGWNLRNNYPHFATFYPADNHVGTKSKKLDEKIIISADEKILGLDNEMLI
jgi:hypothetical protein